MIIINPGSGPVENSTEEHAVVNIAHFILDNGVAGVNYVRIPEHDYKDGRFAFLLWKDNVCHEIQMPGDALTAVRYMDEDNQNIWNYPRLYVDGSSWVWCFALGLSFELDEDD